MAPRPSLFLRGDSDHCLQWESHQSHCRPPLHFHLPWLMGEDSVPCAKGGPDLPTLHWQPRQCRCSQQGLPHINEDPPPPASPFLAPNHAVPASASMGRAYSHHPHPTPAPPAQASRDTSPGGSCLCPACSDPPGRSPHRLPARGAPSLSRDGRSERARKRGDDLGAVPTLPGCRAHAHTHTQSAHACAHTHTRVPAHLGAQGQADLWLSRHCMTRVGTRQSRCCQSQALGLTRYPAPALLVPGALHGQIVCTLPGHWGHSPWLQFSPW